MKQVPSSLLTLVAGILIALISLWVGQNHHLLPEQASEQAALVDNFFNVMVSIATALFIVVQGAILIFAIRFRRRKGDDTDGIPLEGNLPLEAFWTAIPAIIVIWLGIYSVEVYTQMGGIHPPSHGAGMTMAHHHDAKPPGSGSVIAASLPTADGNAALTGAIAEANPYGIGASPKTAGKTADVAVNVTGLQYAWIFNYPKDGITAGELHVPIGKDVQLNISANDVIHSFWVPQFRLKQDAIPGQPAELRFTATKVGSYPVVCAELCGSYHGSMRTKVIVQTPEEYDRWLADNRTVQAASGETTIASISPHLQPWGITAEAIAPLNPYSR